MQWWKQISAWNSPWGHLPLPELLWAAEKARWANLKMVLGKEQPQTKNSQAPPCLL